MKLEQAGDLDPTTDEYATQLVDRYTRRRAGTSSCSSSLKRGDARVDPRRRSASLRTPGGDALRRRSSATRKRRARQWLKVLEDGDDARRSRSSSTTRSSASDHTEAATSSGASAALADDNAEKAASRCARRSSSPSGVGDVDSAIARYERIAHGPRPDAAASRSRPIADLAGGARATRRRRRRARARAQARRRRRGARPIATRLAQPLRASSTIRRSAIRALDIVRKADPEDFDALARLCELCEKTEQWDRVAELLAQRIEVEADEDEASAMTAQLADILADKLDRGDEALAALTELADQGDAGVREAYVELGDRLGWKGIVATKLVDWWLEATPGPRAHRAACAARSSASSSRPQPGRRARRDGDRALEGGRPRARRAARGARDQDRATTTRSPSPTISSRASSPAPARATELVRQAEVRVNAGDAARSRRCSTARPDSTSVPAAEAEPLLERLALLAEKPGDVIDLYERQVSRCKAPADRTRALARAAQVAGRSAASSNARAASSSSPSPARPPTRRSRCWKAARDGDGDDERRREAASPLAEALAAGGQGARDGGRTRGALLRRAARWPTAICVDLDKAFGWLGDALIAHVDDASRSTRSRRSAARSTTLARAEATLTHALTEVFDGPLVRQLLARRAKHAPRRSSDDKPGAAADLKKLHDLSPTDLE